MLRTTDRKKKKKKGRENKKEKKKETEERKERREKKLTHALYGIPRSWRYQAILLAKGENS